MSPTRCTGSRELRRPSDVPNSGGPVSPIAAAAHNRCRIDGERERRCGSHASTILLGSLHRRAALTNAKRGFRYFVALFSAVWIAGSHSQSCSELRSEVYQAQGITRCDSTGGAPRASHSKAGELPKQPTRSPLSAMASAEREHVEKKYGYDWCDERWLDRLEDERDGGVVAEILTHDRCANLGRALIALTRSTDPRVRARTAIILGRVEVPDAARHLSRLIDDADESVASMALRSLCEIDSTSCHKEVQRILLLKGGQKIRRTAASLEGELEAGEFGRCRKHSLHVTLAQRSYRQDEALGGTISVTNDCSEAIVVVVSQLPSVWRVRRFREKKDGETLESWQGSIVGAAAIRGDPAGGHRDEQHTIGSGQKFRQPMDLRKYLHKGGNRIQAGCYGIRFWYEHEPTDDETDPLLLREVLVSEEVRVCVSSG